MKSELNVQRPAARLPEERKRPAGEMPAESRTEQKKRPATNRKKVDCGEVFWSWAMPAGRP